MVRRTAKVKTKTQHLKLSVRGAAALVRRLDRDHARLCGGANATTKIRIEGTSAGENRKVGRETLLLVSRESAETKVAGYALGGTTPWTVSCDLPDEQFRDLLAFVLAGKLHAVEMTFDELRWHKGTLLSAWFGTIPLPSEND